MPEIPIIRWPKTLPLWKLLREVGVRHVTNGSGFALILEQDWRQMAEVLLSGRAVPHALQEHKDWEQAFGSEETSDAP